MAHSLDTDLKLSSKSKAESGAKANIGGSIILVAFVVLCLAIFGTLAFTTAYSDMTLAKKTASTIKEFYNLDMLAQESIAAVDASVFAPSQRKNSVSVLKGNLDELSKTSNLEYNVESDGGNLSVSFACSNETQRLSVTMTGGLGGTGTTPRYKLTSYKLENTLEPDYDQTQLELWNGE